LQAIVNIIIIHILIISSINIIIISSIIITIILIIIIIIINDHHHHHRVILPFLITVELDLKEENMRVSPYILVSCVKEVISLISDGLP